MVTLARFCQLYDLLLMQKQERGDNGLVLFYYFVNIICPNSKPSVHV